MTQAHARLSPLALRKAKEDTRASKNNILLTALFYSTVENRHLDIHKVEGLAFIHSFNVGSLG